MKARAIQAFKYVILPLGLVFALEPLYRSNMWDQTLEQVPNMQELTKLKGMFKTITDLGSAPFVILFYIAIFNLMAKPAALYFWCGMSVVYYTSS